MGISTFITPLGPRQNKKLVLELQISRMYFIDLHARICVKGMAER